MVTFLSNEDEIGLSKHIRVLQDDKLRGMYAPNSYLFNWSRQWKQAGYNGLAMRLGGGDTNAHNAGTLL